MTYQMQDMKRARPARHDENIVEALFALSLVLCAMALTLALAVCLI